MGTNLKHMINGSKILRNYCKVVPPEIEYKCKLLVVGGGAAGCNLAWRFSRKLNNDDIIVLEPSKIHYYQPLFPLIAAGIQQYGKCQKPTLSVLPRQVRWLYDHAEDFDPCNNIVHTKNGKKIRYNYLIIAVGVKNDYEKIPGLRQALNYHNSGVSTIYSPVHCVKTWCCLNKFKGGHAIFTFPRTGSKCSGAAQKIMYLADDYWRQHNLRQLVNITYNTGGDALFGVEKYATALTKIARCRNISVNCCTNLLEVSERGAVFEDNGGKTITLPYNLLHVTPPMSPPVCLMRCEKLVSETGYLDVDKYTLQHTRYPNIYGVGDCINTPNSKTVAAVAGQSPVVERNLLDTMEDKQPSAKYNGYEACPMMTSYNCGILAEFLYDKRLCETFPFDQSKERRLFYYMKKHLFPFIYWNRLIKGKWNGPSTLRKIINPFAR
ncbi:sulfide:quinone oxidoreductase, mitochondrial-like [Aphomia sociella]